MIRKYAPEQIAFLQAQAEFDTINSRVLALLQDEPDEEPSLEMAMRHQAVYTDAGWYKALDRLNTAENALHQWAHEAIKTEKRYQTSGRLIRELFTKIHCYPTLKPKLNDLCLRLQA